MTKSIELGIRGRIIVYFDGKDVKVRNESSCVLIVDNQLLHPGETI
jgi:hypothetical protein